MQRVLVDDAFDAADQEAIGKAVVQWNATLGGVLRFEAGVHHLSLLEDAILIMRIDSSAPFIPVVTTEDGRSLDALAFVDTLGGRYVYIIRDRIMAAWVQPITLHELGHALGARDRKGHGLMHWQFTPSEYSCVDDETRTEVTAWLDGHP